MSHYIITVLRQEVQKVVQQNFSLSLTQEQIPIRRTSKSHQGDYSVLLFAWKTLPELKDFEKIGKVLGDALLSKGRTIKSYERVGGFLNLCVDDELLREAMAQYTSLSSQKSESTDKILIEYSSPNTNKPLHLGHMRNNFLGDALARLLEATGKEVRRVCLVNDRGIHICKSMAAYQLAGAKEVPTQTLKGDHLVGKYYVDFEKRLREEARALQEQRTSLSEKEALAQAPIMKQAYRLLKDWEEEHTSVRALWKQMNQWVYEGFDKTYQKMGIHFDEIYYESKTYSRGKEMVEQGLSKSLFYRREDGAICADLSSKDLDEKVLLRADGTSVYITQELGTAAQKYEDYPFTLSLYVVGDEQNYHFKVLRALLAHLSLPYADCVEHISYGMVDLPSGKMKSREGTVVEADELLEEMEDEAARKTEKLGKTDHMSEEERKQLHRVLALGALKFFLLRTHPKKRMLFDPKSSLDVHAATGTFIQYTYVRLCALLRRAEADTDSSYQTNMPSNPSPEERTLILTILECSTTLEESAQKYDPSLWAQYLYELAKQYNRWYETHPIFNQSDLKIRAWRLQICAYVGKYLKDGLNILGIEVPERM